MVAMWGRRVLSTEILGALLSVLSIWVVTGVLVYLAAQRLLSANYDIEGSVMLITSACAVAANIVYVWPALTLPRCPPPSRAQWPQGHHRCPARRMGVALHQTGHGHSHGAASEQPNASVRAAFVHVVGDLLQSVGILIASYIIFFKVWVVTEGQRGCWGHGDSGFSQPWPGTGVRWRGPCPFPAGADGDLGWGDSTGGASPSCTPSSPSTNMWIPSAPSSSPRWCWGQR